MIETRYFVRASTPHDLAVELAKECRRRHGDVANTDHATGEKIALESVIYMLEHLDIEA